MALACGKDAAPDPTPDSGGMHAGPNAGDGGGGGSDAGGPVLPIALDTERFPPGTCQAQTVRLEGTLDGQPYQLSGAGRNMKQFAGREFYLFDDGFFAYTGGSASAAGNEIGGVLQLGDGWYCAGPGSTGATNDGEHTVALAIHSLGACGDNPVQGEVFSCRGSETQCTGETEETRRSAGSIEGVEWQDSGSGHSYVLGRGVVSFGAAVAYFETAKGIANGVAGVLITGEAHDHAVYCFGNGSTIDLGGSNDPDLFHLTSLSKLKRCPTGKSNNVVHGCFK